MVCKKNEFATLAAFFVAFAFSLAFVGCTKVTDVLPVVIVTPGDSSSGGGTTTTNPGGGSQTVAARGDYIKVGTETIGTKTYDLVTFGLWPQTIKASGVTVDKNTCQQEVHGAFTYCKGNDGEWYVEQAEKAYDFGYKYSDGTTVGRGGTSAKWFKVEPIKWRVLTTNYGGAKLLLAESILTGGVPYCLNSRRTIGGATVYANNYKYSTIRAWLNGKYESDDTQDKTHAGKGFLQSAFTSAQQGQIKTTTVDNSARSTNPDANATQWNSGANQYASDTPTSDKIFLLSEKEVTTSAYGFEAYDSYGTGNKRIRVTTDFAKATGAYQSSDAGMGGWWWLRSPDCGFNFARSVADSGNASDCIVVDNNIGGVAPALCIEN